MNDRETRPPSEESAEAAYERAVRKDFRRNAFAYVTWEFVWGLGLPFAMFATLAPAYLHAVHAPKMLIGFVAGFSTLFAPLAVMAAYWVTARRRPAIVLYAYVIGLTPWFLYGLAAAIWGRAWPESVHWILFTLAMACFMAAVAAMQPVYNEMMTDTTPKYRRGLLFGMRNAAVGGTGLALSFVTVRLLAHWPAPFNYRFSFVIGTGVMLLSCASLVLIRDHANPAHAAHDTDEPPPLMHWLRKSLREVWNEPNYRIMIFFQALLALAGLGASFIITAAGDLLHATPQQQGVFSTLYLCSVAGLAWVIGLIADRWGFRLVGFLVAALMSGAYAVCLASRSLTLWYAAYAAVALANVTWISVQCNLGAEICPNLKPGRLMALGSSLVLLLVVPGMAICGRVVDFLGSYQPIFVAYFAISLVSALGYAFIVREPRSGELYAIRPVVQR